MAHIQSCSLSFLLVVFIISLFSYKCFYQFFKLNLRTATFEAQLIWLRKLSWICQPF